MLTDCLRNLSCVNNGSLEAKLKEMNTTAETIERIAVESLRAKEEIGFAHQNDFLLRRLALIGIASTARKFPEVLQGIYNHLILKPSHRWVGAGYDHVVITDGTSALKIDRASRHMPPDLQETRAQERQTRYEQGSRVMNGYMLPQFVQVQLLPTRYPMTACVTEQSLEQVVTDVAQPRADQVLRDLYAYGVPAAKIGDRLERFCEMSEEAFNIGGLTPDIGGRGNIVVTRDRGLTLLDSYLMDAEQREGPMISEEFATIGEHHRVTLDRLWERADELRAG